MRALCGSNQSVGASRAALLGLAAVLGLAALPCGSVVWLVLRRSLRPLHDLF